MAHKSDDCCHQHNLNNTVTQTLSEMDFERGIWNAVIYNEIDRVKDFIRKGETNLTDNCGYTALHYASRNGNEEICKLLLNANANVNAQTNGGVTALHRAAMMGHLNIVKLLINYGAKIDIKDNDGQTALHRSVVKKNIPIIKYLCKCSDNLKLIKDNKNRIPLDLISNDINDELKELLTSKQNV